MGRDVPGHNLDPPDGPCCQNAAAQGDASHVQLSHDIPSDSRGQQCIIKVQPASLTVTELLFFRPILGQT